MDRNLISDPNGKCSQNTRKKDLRVGEKGTVRMSGNTSFGHSSRDRKLAKTHCGLCPKQRKAVAAATSNSQEK